MLVNVLEDQLLTGSVTLKDEDFSFVRGKGSLADGCPGDVIERKRESFVFNVCFYLTIHNVFSSESWKICNCVLFSCTEIRVLRFERILEHLKYVGY